MRRWLWRCGAPAFQSVWLEQLRAMTRARSDAEGALEVGGWEVHRHRGWLVAFPRLPPAEPERVLPWPDPAEPMELGPAHGRLLRADGVGPAPGLPLALPPGARLSVRFRRGGERLRPATGAGPGPGSRPLKKVLQERDVPCWLRDRVPLLLVDERLAAVGDYVIDAAFAPSPDRPATLCLRWDPPAAD